MVDVVCTDVAENALPTPVLSNGIGLGVAPLWSWGGIAHGINSQLIIVDYCCGQYDRSKV